MKIKKKQKLAKEWFIKLQNIICNNVEQLEKEYGSNKKFKKKKVYPETEDLTHQKGPYVGDVGSEGKRRKAGPRGKGKSPGRRAPQPERPKAPEQKGRRPWRGTPPGRPRPGTPAPKYGPGPKKTWPPKHRDLLRRFPKMPQPHKSPGDTPYIPKPKYTPGEPKIVQPAATGGRIGLKKGGSDKNWIQKAVNPKHKGFCTPMTKKTCTPRRKALARTFKKMGRERKAKG